jgi:hypothetical protein
MLWKTIKKILQKQGGKCIIIEEGQPTYLVIKIEDFEENLDEDKSSEIDRVNQDINEWKGQESEESIQDTKDVKIEDLPF